MRGRAPSVPQLILPVPIIDAAVSHSPPRPAKRQNPPQVPRLLCHLAGHARAKERRGRSWRLLRLDDGDLADREDHADPSNFL